MNVKLARVAVLGIVCALCPARPHAQGTPDPWYGRQAKPQNFDSPKVFTNTFSIELPKNWQFAPGHTGTIFSVVEKTPKWQTGGLITLEYQKLQLALDPSMVANVSERELKEVQLRELAGKQFTGAVKTGALGPIILIQYDRPGISGSDDHVAQYSIPIGTTMYRLICIAPTASIAKYRPVFAHAAASFASIKPGGS